MNGSIPETEWKTPFRGSIRSGCTLTMHIVLRSNRPLERSFSLRFEGRSVHNAHLLCCVFGVGGGGGGSYVFFLSLSPSPSLSGRNYSVWPSFIDSCWPRRDKCLMGRGGGHLKMIASPATPSRTPCHVHKPPLSTPMRRQPPTSPSPSSPPEMHWFTNKHSTNLKTNKHVSVRFGTTPRRQIEMIALCWLAQ